MREPISSTDAFAIGNDPADSGSPDVARLFDLIADGVQGSVLLTGQQAFRGQRSGRYTPASTPHPAKMMPTIPRYLIATYTDEGDLVADPMAGIGTTIVEAMHLGRHGIGIEYEPRWATLAAGNIRLATGQGATGTGEIYTGDARRLPALLPPEMHGRISLVITSPPYGASTHGRAITPGRDRGKVQKINNRYGADTGNLAYAGHTELIEGFIQILTGCAAVLQPGGYVAVTARPYRQHGELVDIPGMVAAAGLAAGLTLVEELIALIAGVRDGVLVPRASFFQRQNVREALTAGDPQWLIQHEDLLILQTSSHTRPAPGLGRSDEPRRRTAGPARSLTDDSTGAHRQSGRGGQTPSVAVERSLDPSTAVRMDRCPQPDRPVNASAPGRVPRPRQSHSRTHDRTPDSCPRDPQPVPGAPRAHWVIGPGPTDNPSVQGAGSTAAGQP
ncbi:DNA methyltransferase [Dactylosporangium sp. NPDC051484]|uniref:TRM11 family SAM-dependent methyltransferase n=1 Tax=Dactylosporangium sp. NPDC051484 TaxID=3154942 RepID=UPI00344D836B